MPDRTCAIMQPTYLPWIGFFDLMDQVDEFVFLDTVQFSKQSWQQRNRIRWGDDHKWLTVPVNQNLGQKINRVEIVQGCDFTNEHLERMLHSYKDSARYFEAYFPEIKRIVRSGDLYSKLADLNVQIISRICKLLGMRRFASTLGCRRTSQMNITGDRSGRLVEICRKLKCSRYLSPPGAKEYLSKDRSAFDEAGIGIVMQKYEHPRYSQGGLPFVSHLSVVDLLLNEGAKSLEIIRSGRGAPTELEA